MVQALGITDMAKLHYCHKQMSMNVGLRFIGSDDDVKIMLREVGPYGMVEIFVEHVHEEECEVGVGSASEGEAFLVDDDGSDSEAASLDHVSEEDDELVEVRLLQQKRKNRKKRKRGHTVSYVEDNVEVGDGDVEDNMDVGDVEENERNEDVVADVVDVGRNEDVAADVVDVLTLCDVEDIESDYRGSSDYVTSETSEDESDEDGVRHKRKLPVWCEFNPGLDFFKIELKKGMKFGSPNQLKDALICYAVNRGSPLRFVRSGKDQILVKCATGCPFRLWATWMNAERSFQIKSLVSEHTCHRHEKLKLANSRWIANQYKERILGNPSWKPADMAHDVLEKYALEVTRVQCQKAKRIALGEVEKSLVGHYAKLWDYASEFYYFVKLSLLHCCYITA